MTNKDLEKLSLMTAEARKIAMASTERLSLSTRVYYRIIRVARTIADLDGAATVRQPHVAEAVSYRLAIAAKN